MMKKICLVVLLLAALSIPSMIAQTSRGATSGSAVTATLVAETTKVIGTVRAAVSGFADGAIVTLGLKADAKSTATDTTAITIMQVLKQISFSTQAIAALASTDPCTGVVKVNKPFTISSATTTVLVAASASNKLYVCSLLIFPISATDNFELVEDASGSCASPDAGIAGSTTDTTGANMVANQGLAWGTGAAMVAVTASTNVNVCAITSTTAKLNGNLSYVLAP